MQILSSPSFLSISTFIFIFVFTITSPTSFSQDYDYGQLYRNCSSVFSCGRNFPNIIYPFWGGNQSSDCGLEEFYLTCHQENHLTIDISGQTFRVLSINGTSYSIRIAQDDLWINSCPVTRGFVSSNFRPGPEVEYLSLSYGCPDDAAYDTRIRFNCTNASNHPSTVLYKNVSGCESNISVPFLQSEAEEFKNNNTSVDLRDLLFEGFNVEYNLNRTACFPCEVSRGLCWVRTNSTGSCLCSDGLHDQICHRVWTWKQTSVPFLYGRESRVRWKIAIGFGAAAGSALVTCFIFLYCMRRQKQKKRGSTLLSREISSDPSSVYDPETAIGNTGVHIFDYNELEQATNNFDSEQELGDGGFGTVYKGKLKDGRVVAVKRLYESNFKRVEHFINEVVILTRLRHQNLVTLYGCTSRHSRELLLVYEYVPNGTVADHLHGALAMPGSLPWSTRMRIAIETASALSYLHASDVIHRDVKTNNILLDADFHVKVADFGLSRLFPINATHISTAPQGTPGYVDPEYHECYHLTDKSDVFSFGVVLIELISSLPAVDITRHRHDINLSNMAVNKIQGNLLHELVDPNIGYESDYNVRMMITDVAELAFQSLQYGRDMRPSMQEVLETLMLIQDKDYSSGNTNGNENQADDVALLKARQLISSPNSVIEGIVSNTTTPNTSS